MPEFSRWSSMNERGSSRMFGIYRDPDATRNSSVRINFKLIFLLIVIASTTLVVFVVTVKLTANEDNGTDIIEKRQDVEEINIIIPTSKTKWLNSTGGRAQERVQDSLSKPIETEILTETYSAGSRSQGDRAVVQEATTPALFKQRNGRAYPHESTKARIINRPRFPDQTDSLISYAQPPVYSDHYPQLEGYKSPIRGLHDVMSWIDMPGVKFSGVYYKAEDERPYLNGHAYVSDPFVKFKPPHPAEINQLAVEPDRGPRFSTRPLGSEGDSVSSGSQTQAIFHPYSPMRPRPLKIMLDIYPVIPEPPIPIGTRPNEQMADPRGRRPRFPQPSMAKRMVVQLNLYPKKNSRISRTRPTTQEETVEQKMLDVPIKTDVETVTEQLTTEVSFEDTTLITSE